MSHLSHESVLPGLCAGNESTLYPAIEWRLVVFWVAYMSFQFGRYMSQMSVTRWEWGRYKQGRHIKTRRLYQLKYCLWHDSHFVLSKRSIYFYFCHHKSCVAKQKIVHSFLFLIWKHEPQPPKSISSPFIRHSLKYYKMFWILERYWGA